MHTEGEILKAFDGYGVSYVVVEENDQTNLKIHKSLRDLLDTDRFEVVREIPIQSNRRMLQAQTLRIYRYLDQKPLSAENITLSLPIVGHTLQVPTKNLPIEVRDY